VGADLHNAPINPLVAEVAASLKYTGANDRF